MHIILCSKWNRYCKDSILTHYGYDVSTLQVCSWAIPVCSADLHKGRLGTCQICKSQRRWTVSVPVHRNFLVVHIVVYDLSLRGQRDSSFLLAPILGELVFISMYLICVISCSELSFNLMRANIPKQSGLSANEAIDVVCLYRHPHIYIHITVPIQTLHSWRGLPLPQKTHRWVRRLILDPCTLGSLAC